MSVDQGTQSEVQVEVDYTPRVNFAFHQNAIPVIRRIEIRNTTDRRWEQLRCEIRPEPNYSETLEIEVSQIDAQSDHTIFNIPIALDFRFLADLSEKLLAEFHLCITALPEGSDEREIVYEKTYPIDVYASDEWTGLETLPEILAAFITPNVAVVEEILGHAADLLRERTGSSALDGYQQRSKARVYATIGAIYDAVHSLGVRYSAPPVSFEQTGQRVRFAEHILDSQFATCLDFCLLFAALIEQAGLRPLVLLQKGHSYVGCWLGEESFPEPSVADLQSVRKRVELDDLLVFESTLCQDGSSAVLKSAEQKAREHLHQNEIFLYAIDVHRARMSGIRPLPLNRGGKGIDTDAIESVIQRPPSEPLSRSSERTLRDDIIIEASEETPQNRIDGWKQQLLDLTLRNRLINFRETKQTIPIACADLGELEDAIAANVRFKLRPESHLMTGQDPRDLALLIRNGEDDPIHEHLREELRSRRLRTPLSEKETARRLLELYRKTRVEIEESGANTLYLALGFLEWKESPHTEKTHRAPILLVPAKLIRPSVVEGFSIEREDEDALVNVTLLELLRQDFGKEIVGVDPPPEDESGVDVHQVLRLFEQAVRDMHGWEVNREAWLGRFSFKKFLMWKDLQDRLEALTQNPVVDHLVHKAGQPYFDDTDDVLPQDLDKKVKSGDLYCPLSADSSQLAAIVAAASGKNFVLFGPPGTGKSQTIANLITHNLAAGKRILFVAEKRAALEVVHHRLSVLGLDPFCLELHSNKSGKTDVLKQFGKAMDFAGERTSQEWEYMAKRLDESRTKLNSFVAELHKPGAGSLSVFQCYSYLVRHKNDRGLEDVEALSFGDISSHKREGLERLRDLCDQLVRRFERLSPASRDRLAPVKASQWSPTWEEEAVANAESLSRTIQDLKHRFREVVEAMNLQLIASDENVVFHFAQLVAYLLKAPVVPQDFLTSPNWSNFAAHATTWIDEGLKRDAARDALAGFDLDVVRGLDIHGLRAQYEEINKDSGLLRVIKTWMLLRHVRKARNAGSKKWSAKNAVEFFENAAALKATEDTLKEAVDEACARLGADWSFEGCNWEHLADLIDFGSNLQSKLAALSGTNAELLVSIRETIAPLLTNADDLLGTSSTLRGLIVRFCESWNAFHDSRATFWGQLNIDSDALLPGDDFFDRIEGLANCISSYRDELRNWCSWVLVYSQARQAELSPLAEALANDRLSSRNFRQAFEVRYREAVVRHRLGESSELRDFWEEEHEDVIAKYSELDESYTRLAADAAIARLASELPRARKRDCPQNSELGIIQRERQRQRGHRPVRRLLADIPSVLPKLKPCLLMSPLSVAQYLQVSQDNFDIVVFDEASQIPVWDAIGAIARGSQVIVVGDPKQLPPTNFFNRVGSDEYTLDDGLYDDLESILDECIGAGLPKYYLQWHYRSKYEGLIAFSNFHYYGNQLLTFPSSRVESTGVSLIRVPDGCYDKGKTRTNLAEAEAVVADIVRRLQDPETSHQSLGVVTFSQAQQDLIENLLDDARRAHADIEPYFTDTIDEPVFVKNLENVQGDERDVILFSVCYGPDANGNVSMNFGPLNREGGARRLNVAVSRAKQEVSVFSTLRPEQIDLARTRAEGVVHLKSYLEYAERGPRALAQAVESSSYGEYESILEEEIGTFLEKEGYEIRSQVGCSGYRIDLAVVDPENPGRFILGIECDGATYHRAATARDRDRLRQLILEKLGWRMTRVWSTEWWRNRDQASERLLREVEQAVESGPAENISSEVGDSPFQEPEPEEEPIRFADNVVTQPEADHSRIARGSTYPHIRPHNHQDQDLFYEAKGRSVVRKEIMRIVNHEGPITQSLLMQRVAEEWGFSRVGEKIRSIINSCCPSSLAKTEQFGQPVYWPDKLMPGEFANFRKPNPQQPERQRSLEEIPVEELSNGVVHLLEEYISCPETELMRETAGQFGCRRLTDNARKILQEAIDRLGPVVVRADGVVKMA